MRLDAYLAEHYPEYSRSTWQKYIKQGFVKVNDKSIISPKLELGEDDQVTYEIAHAIQKEIDIPVIYEDENVIVIDKPTGILSHSKGTLNLEPTVATWLYPRLADDWRQATGDNQANRLGIVHRLDRDTSGVMILARNIETAALLQKQFANRKVKKTYVAIVKGKLENDEANIDLPIERNPKMPSQFRVGAKGKAALTHYKVLAHHEKYHMLGLRPETGRTHQLRVHLAYINAPIVGDRIYGTKADRLYLHATSLEITIPISQRRVFVSQLPDAFAKIMNKS